MSKKAKSKAKSPKKAPAAKAPVVDKVKQAPMTPEESHEPPVIKKPKVKKEVESDVVLQQRRNRERKDSRRKL